MRYQVLETRCTGSLLTFHLRRSRQKIASELVTKTPGNFKITDESLSKGAKILRIEVTDVEGSQFDLIERLEMNRLIVDSYKFLLNGKEIESPNLISLQKNILLELQIDREEYLSLEWGRDRVLEDLNDMFSDSSFARECLSDRQCEQARSRIHTAVYLDTKRFYKISRREALEHLNRLTLSSDQIKAISNECFKALDPDSNVHAVLSLNQTAERAPRVLLQNLEPLVLAANKPELSSDDVYNILGGLSKWWKSNKDASLRYYDLYRLGLKILHNCIHRGSRATFTQFSAGLDEVDSLRFGILAFCLEYLMQEKVNLRYSPDNNQIFWHTFKDDLSPSVLQSLADQLPESDDSLCLWSQRRYLAMHYSSRLEEYFAVAKIDQNSLEYFVSIVSNPSFSKLNVAKNTLSSIARRLIRLGHYSYAIKVVSAFQIGRFSSEFLILDLYSKVVSAATKPFVHSNEVLDRIFSMANRSFLFEIGSEWEQVCHCILKQNCAEVLADLNNETRLENGLRPDFIVGRVERVNSRIQRGETFIDAKKSLLAITSDIEEYTPYCDKLVFYVLDDDVSFSLSEHPNVSVKFASELINEALCRETRKKIIDLMQKSANSKEEVRARFEKFLRDFEADHCLRKAS